MKLENEKSFSETKNLRQEFKSKKRENAKILLQKDALDSDVRKMQNETDELEIVYKELLLLSNELKTIKRNMIPSALLENGSPDNLMSP